MSKVIIFGTGSWARKIFYYLSEVSEHEVVAFTADGEFCEPNTFMNLPVISFNDLENRYAPDQYAMFMGIGYREMNNIRERKYLDAKKKGYCFPNFIHPTSVMHNTVIGEANFIFENVAFEPYTTVEDNNVFITSCAIAHDVTIKSHSFISLGAGVAGDSTIESNCFLGVHSSVLNGLVIADHTLVGAGCHVTRSTQSYDVVVPARSVVLENKRSTDFL